MPILYVVVLASDKSVITQCLGSKTTGNFLQQVLKFKDDFKTWGKQKLVLDSELNLHYRDLKDYCIACICSAYDITDLEA